MTQPVEPRWARAELAASLFALDPGGLGGLWVRARPGPVRDRFLGALTQSMGSLPKVTPTISDEALYGGIDLAGTLRTGRPVQRKGLIDKNATVLHLTMAERIAPDLAARLAAISDAGTHGLLAVDEGAEDDEKLPLPLIDRFAFHIDLGDIAMGNAPAFVVSDLTEARERLPAVTVPPEAIPTLVQTALALGIVSLRAPMLALRTARALAALSGDDVVEVEHLEGAVALVLAPRATQLPAPPQEEEAEDAEAPLSPEDSPDPGEPDRQEQTEAMADRLIDAARAVLPDGVLTLAALTSRRGAHGSGAGAKQQGNRRGRPLPSRPGRPGGDARIDLVATLRSAAPWQPVRRRQNPNRPGLQIRPSDLRVKRYQDRSDRLVIFAVDASGSAAAARLAEAKGAVELLLAQAYARRDQVALIGFRRDMAELLLPPTRSLVQTKRRLAGLPGGGGTPLAAGLESAAGLAVQMRKRGLTPLVALLTDGRANIALDGTADRVKAAEDASTMARLFRASGVESVILDTAIRPQKALSKLATEMGGRYLPLPRANAHGLGAALDDSG